MTRQALSLAPVALAALIGGCATGAADDYPSLAIRDAERWTGTIAAEPYVPPPPPSASVNEAGALADAARAAHGRFLAALPGVRSRVNAARGSGVGSEAWSVAQVAVADLEAHRSAAMIALADLDRIYVSVATEGQETAPVADPRAAIEALVAEENAAIEGLLAALR